MTMTRHAKTFENIIVFADGACSGNPGPGGWGAIIVTPDGKVTELGGRDPATTNNKMEMAAVGKALRFLENVPGTVAVYTDSVYVINGITKWIWGWMKNGWKTAEGKEVANTEYWKRLLDLTRGRASKFGDQGKLEWHYVRGHSGIPGNERVDEIAVAFTQGHSITLYQGPLIKYPVAIHDIPDDTAPPERKAKDKAAKKEAYSYLSLVGTVAKRHATWKECEGRVKGVPHAKFKKCASLEEERQLLENWGVQVSEDSKVNED